MTAITSLYTCPACGDHAVQVTDQGFSASTVEISRCEAGPEWIRSTTARKSALLDMTPWNEAARYQHRDGLVVFG